MERLTTIEDRLRIHHNPVLAGVDGQDSLEVVGSLEIYRNPQLVSLQGLGSLHSIALLSVTEKPMLPTCEAEWVHDNRLNAGIAGCDRGMVRGRIGPPA